MLSGELTRPQAGQKQTRAPSNLCTQGQPTQHPPTVSPTRCARQTTSRQPHRPLPYTHLTALARLPTKMHRKQATPPNLTITTSAPANIYKPPCKRLLTCSSPTAALSLTLAESLPMTSAVSAWSLSSSPCTPKNTSRCPEISFTRLGCSRAATPGMKRARGGGGGGGGTTFRLCWEGWPHTLMEPQKSPAQNEKKPTNRLRQAGTRACDGGRHGGTDPTALLLEPVSTAVVPISPRKCFQTSTVCLLQAFTKSDVRQSIVSLGVHRYSGWSECRSRVSRGYMDRTTSFVGTRHVLPQAQAMATKNAGLPRTPAGKVRWWEGP